MTSKILPVESMSIESRPALQLYPAIDVRDGAIVRLQQGDYARETRYDSDPFELARRYATTGARWLHLVDLDAAKAGGYTLLPLLQRIKRETGLFVQTGGGVRSGQDVARLLAAGADRVVIGSLAVREPERVCGWLAQFGAERLTIALDCRADAEGRWQLPVHGWTEPSPATLDERLAGYRSAGLRHLLCTDIDRDGLLAGPNFELYARLREQAPTLRIQASGGVRSLDDIPAAAQLGLSGLVLGRALLEGRFTLLEALSC